MLLSELKIGEKGVIVKVTGHGAFRKRIVEMGFIRGKEVKTILNAPLRDPVEYKIMGFNVSLRRNEAEHVEVISTGEAQDWAEHEGEYLHGLPGCTAATEKGKTMEAQEKKAALGHALGVITEGEEAHPGKDSRCDTQRSGQLQSGTQLVYHHAGDRHGCEDGDGSEHV
jgi:Fe2+ transport system protein FeoA